MHEACEEVKAKRGAKLGNWNLQVGDLFIQAGGVGVSWVELDPEDYLVWRSCSCKV